MRTVSRRPRIRVDALLGSILALVLGSCSPGTVLGNDALPPDVPDPTHVQTPDGALAIYRGAISQFGQAFGGHDGDILSGGILTDELQDGLVGLAGTGTSGSGWMFIDARSFSNSDATDFTYSALQSARGQINQALGALRAYAPNAPVALQGRLHALEGYDEIFLADLFCSGVPLSTLDFNGDFTYEPGSPTDTIYQRAAVQFDSALTLATDSADVMNLARVGKARALLGLGDYPAAEEAVAGVPDDFREAITYAAGKELSSNFALSAWGSTSLPPTMADREGGNGLPYRSSGDPRTPSAFLGSNQYGVPIYRPTQYATDGSTPIVLASGVEARLTEAEAQLHAGEPTWLPTLNALRTDGSFDTQQDPVDATKTDTLWHAGSGGVPGLAPLEDPATADRRLDVLFQERGYWLFLTGHRQGDLRRLIREYQRNSESVYPTGAYAGLSGLYGIYVNAPIPQTEQLYNPKFHGCLNRGA